MTTDDSGKSKSKKFIVYLHKSHDFCTPMEYSGMIILSMLLSLQNRYWHDTHGLCYLW